MSPSNATTAAQRFGSGTRRLTRAYRVLPHERRLAAYASVGLFLTLFLPWYQRQFFVVVRGKPVPASDSQTAWGAFSFVEAALLLVAIGVLTLLFQRAEGRAFHLPGGDGWVITAAGVWSCVLVIWRIFDKQGGAAHGQDVISYGIEWGIFVALAGAVFLTYTGSRIRAAHRPEPPLPGDARPRAGGRAAGDRAERGAAGDRAERGAAGDRAERGAAGDRAERGAAGDRAERGAAPRPVAAVARTGGLARDRRRAPEPPPRPLTDEEPRTVPRDDAPTLPRDEDPTVPREEDPMLPRDEDPTVRRQGPPAVPSDEDPTVPRQGPPAVPSDEDPTLPREAAPAVPSDEDPTLPRDEPPTRRISKPSTQAARSRREAEADDQLTIPFEGHEP